MTKTQPSIKCADFSKVLSLTVIFNQLTLHLDSTVMCHLRYWFIISTLTPEQSLANWNVF